MVASLLLDSLTSLFATFRYPGLAPLTIDCVAVEAHDRIDSDDGLVLGLAL